MSEVRANELIDHVVLGRYRIVSKLASGGMGAVYLGRTEGAEGFARPVVIKRVLPGLRDDDEIARMFVREAQILSNLQHPNIVPVLDFGRDDDHAYLMVLEYVHGYPLSDWQQYLHRKQARLPADFVLHIALKVLDALHYAHTFTSVDGKFMGIVHRDVTPTNILLDERGTVKLLDFGIARASGDQALFMTERSRVKGKLPYLPPEALEGADPDVRTDVYSVAVVVYELLTGGNPFLGPNATATCARTLEFEPPPVRTLRTDVPPAIDVALAHGMHKQASERFASAGEFARALRAVGMRSEELIVPQLAAQLRVDFNGTMPSDLGLQRLAERERAWRTGKSGQHPAVQVSAPKTSDNTTQSTTLLGATLETDVSESVLAKARRSSPPPTAAPSILGVLSRSVLIAAIAAVISAAAALAAWLGVKGSGPSDQLVVISRESSAGQLPVAAAPEPRPRAPEPPAPEPKPEPEPSEHVAATAQQTSVAARAPSRPVEPDPDVLSRTFGRRQAQVVQCFNKHAAAADTGPVSLHFRVKESGEVAEVHVKPAALEPTPLGRCMLEIARSTRFGPLARAVSFQIPLSVQKL